MKTLKLFSWDNPTGTPTVNRQSTDGQSQGHYSLGLTKLLFTISLLLTLSVGQMLGASVTSDGTKKLYFNVNTNHDWWKTTYMFGYFYNCASSSGCGTSAWSTNAVQANGDIYYITIPSGTWQGVILTRNSSSTAGWSSKWNQSGDITLAANDNYISAFSENSSAVSWADYAPSPAIIGSMNSWDATTNAFSDGSVSISLSANTTYEFKIIDGTTYYGNNLAFVGQTGSLTMSTSEDNCHITTAGAGTYTFEFNSSTKALSVTYPSVTHPSSDYVYFKNTDSWANVKAHIYTSSTAVDNWPGPEISSFNFDGTNYYYAALGAETSIIFSKSGDDSKKTENLTTASSNKGKYYDKSSSTWKNFTATLSLDHQSATNTPAPDNVTVTYNATTNINTDIITTTPTKTGYTFGGYYTSKAGSGTQIINTSEKIPSTLDGYTSSGKWIKTGSSVSMTIYAKWTQALDLNSNGATSAGTTSVTATFNGGIGTITTAPSRTGYNFGGWYPNSDGSGDLIINASKELQSNKTNWTDASGKWIHAGASTLYAKWTAKTYSITLHDNNGGSNNGSATATYNSGSLSSVSAPTRSGYHVVGYYKEAGLTNKIADADGTLIASTAYTDGSGNWTNDGAVTLYAEWAVDAVSYSLSFAAASDPYDNGSVSGTVAGSSVASGSAHAENSAVVLTATPSTHYRVMGWYTDATCETEISGDGAPGTSNTYSFSLTGNTTIYVGFELSHTAIQLFLNTGTSGATDITATHGSALTSFTLAQKSGYTLNGYFTEESGGTLIINADGTLARNTAYTTDESTPKWNSYARNLDLYAQWTEDKETLTPTVNYNAGTSTYTASADNTIGVTTTSRIRCSKPDPNHYTFAGWTLTNLTVTSGNAATDTVIYVKKASADGATPSAVANYNEVLTQSTWVLKGGTNITGDNWSEEHAMNKKSGESTSDVVYYTCNITKTNSGSDSNNSFSFKIVKKGDSDTWYGLGSGAGQYWYYHDTGEQTMGTSNMDVQIIANAAGEYVIKLDYRDPSSPKVTVEFPSQFLKGDWDDWVEHAFDKDGYYRVNLAASTTYEFCVNYKSTIYKKNKTITATNYDEVFNTSENNCKLTTTTAGYYVFGWNGSTKQLSVIFPSDTTKCKMTKDEYIYFDTRNLTSEGSGWHSSDFSSRFWFKNFASGVDYGNVDCAIADTVEDGIYYAKVPAANIGQVQIDRMKPDFTERWCTADKVYALDRTNATYNLLKEETGKENYCNNWKPQWSTTTYCPPMKTAVVADNGTTIHSGSGTKANPYLIEKSATIKVTAASSTAFNDDANMTHKYHFYDGSTSKSDQTGATYSFTASSSANTVHKIVVMPYNTYNSQSSRKTLKSDTLYYKTVNHYTVTYSAADATGGSVPTDATHYITGENATVLDNTGSLTKEGYTFNGWKDAGGTSHSAGSTITIGTSDVMLSAQWADDHNYYFSGATDKDWSKAANWTKGQVPNDIANTVYILAPVEISTGTTIKAAAVNIVTGGTYTRPAGRGTIDAAGNLAIAAGGELIISGTIKRVADAANMSTKSVTREEDIFINSDQTHGLGALTMDSYDGTNNATINFYTLSNGSTASSSAASASDAQYVGTPFGNNPTMLYQFYNSWMYKFVNTTSPTWERVGGDDKLEAFKGYCLFSADGTGHSYWMQGTLVTSADQSISLVYHSGDGSNAINENMLANSWMAPIRIKSFGAGDFTKADATIYIYNTGSPDDYSSKESLAGQYSSYPISSCADAAIIPSMQAFSVYTNASGGSSIKLDYNKLVYNPAVNGTVTPGPNKAPRIAGEEEEEPEKMRLYIGAESGYGDMVYMLEREDFAENFENGWDGRKMFGNDVAPQLYAFTPDGNMAINCIPTFEGQVLGFRKGTKDNVYTFTFEYDGENTWYLNDLKEQTSTLISADDSYMFTASTEDMAARFVISATPIRNTPTGVDNNSQNSKVESRKLLIDGVLYIIRNGQMYNVTGAMVR